MADKKVEAVRSSEKMDAIKDEATEWIGLLRASQSSVEITQDAKGGTKITVKAYADSSDGAAEAAVETYNKLVKDLGIV